MSPGRAFLLSLDSGVFDSGAANIFTDALNVLIESDSPYFYVASTNVHFKAQCPPRLYRSG
jgi:hypothetical protein